MALVTDAEERIVPVNHSFTTISGFQADEVLVKNPSFQRSGRQDAAFYQGMWKTLEDEGQWQGEIWSRRKDGELYPLRRISA
jgi:PAS domain S-box-containing protein